MELHRPKEDKLPYVCLITFTAAGGAFGDIVQVCMCCLCYKLIGKISGLEKQKAFNFEATKIDIFYILMIFKFNKTFNLLSNSVEPGGAMREIEKGMIFNTL